MSFEIELPKPKVSIFDNYVPILVSTDTRQVDIYLTEAIGAPSEYNETCLKLKTAKKGDVINIHINNPGGYAGSAFMIVDAIKQSKAKTIAHLYGDVASAATIITMACDDIIVSDYLQFMCHNYSHGTQGGGSQVKEYVNFTDREFSKAVTLIYKGFLSEKEMEQISTQDKEIWLNSDEVKTRWAAKKAKPIVETAKEL